MNPTREELLFQLALTKPAVERGPWLDAECDGDAALRQRLEALLAAHEQPGTLLASQAEAARPTIKLDLADAPDEAVGQTIGRYKLLERVGEGGCGVVYVAEQTEPVRRRVALKVIKLGMDTKAVVARFEAERQALAMLDHPNIAKVLDAGMTEGRLPSRPEDGDKNVAAPMAAGRPYFVMELVRGIRITDYCDQANLTTKERLDLFIKVCQAIQHAHQKGIIHRDIKPSNILVTLHDGVPVPKVIDFGIAKATEGRLTDATVYTQLHQFIGTPAYMSPEQAEMSGLDIDTRSDIYSLGVLLYELLAGSTPFDAKELMAGGIDAMRKTIREKEPVRPSTKLSQTLGAIDKVGRVAPRAPSSGESSEGGGAHGVTRPTTQSEQAVRADSRRLLRVKERIRQLKGDLDWIVMKCLEKDRARRYDTANGLAADLRRHLSNEPVIARPPSTAYRFQKLVRRNKLAFAAAAAVALALVLGITGSVRQAVRATRAKQHAQASEAKANKAQAEASQQREVAVTNERTARQNLYANDMLLAFQALDRGNIGRTRELVRKYAPEPGQDDFRGWEWRYLWWKSRGDELFTLGSHSAVVTVAAFFPDGRTVASARMWCFQFTPDSRKLAVGYQDLAVELWELSDGSKTTMRTAHKDYVRDVAFSDDAQMLATTGWGREGIQLWDFRTREELAKLRGHFVSFGSPTFSPDNRRLAGFDDDGSVTLWDMANPQRPEVCKLSGNSQGSGKFLADGNTIVARDGERLRIWRAPSWEEIAVAEAKDPPAPGYGGQGRAESQQP
jgi:serine/threonine protein kinase